ncbi:MAG: methionyl-tRNA formyltransferase [Clostridia bacterium]|nr:methionyl-tRNA formyltransferase [Clostridia bacterium]
MKIVYMGTPDFAVLPLQALIEDGHEISLVVTQPDKPKGRGHKMMPPPVKVCAEEHGIPTYQPLSMKTDEAYETLVKENADLFVVAAFGKILPQRILDLPKHGSICIHASLLPKYRGAAPIQRCIMDGETISGVTTMLMDAGIDTGDMLVKESVEITDAETGETLHDKLAIAGVVAIRKTIEQIQNGTLAPEKQDDSLSCYAPMIDKTTGILDFSKPAKELYNLIRGLNSYPYASTTYGETPFKVISAKVADTANGAIGEVVSVNADGILVKCGEGALFITEVQFAGKKKMPVSEYIKGNKLDVGVILGA